MGIRTPGVCRNETPWGAFGLSMATVFVAVVLIVRVVLADGVPGLVPVEGRKHDKNKHVAPAPPVDPTPAPPPVRPHIDPVPDERFIDVVDGKHPKPDKHKVVVPDPAPTPPPHVQPVTPIHTHIWIVRVILAGLVIGGITIASIIHGRRE